MEKLYLVKKSFVLNEKDVYKGEKILLDNIKARMYKHYNYVEDIDKTEETEKKLEVGTVVELNPVEQKISTSSVEKKITKRSKKE